MLARHKSGTWRAAGCAESLWLSGFLLPLYFTLQISNDTSMSLNLNVATAKELHKTGHASKLHGRFQSGLLKAVVYGANDGIVTTFAVVAGVSGAGLAPAVILILGIGNMIADGLSMGLGDFLGERSERRHMQHQYKIESWETKNIPEEEREELCVFFKKYDVQKPEAKQLADIITKNPKLWTMLGFVDEFGIAPNFEKGLWKSGLITFISFVVAGSLPLLPYILGALGAPIPLEHQFSISIFATVTSLFFVGSLRTLITKGDWWKNGFEMLFIGTIAASAAYFVGAVIESVV